MQARTIRFVAKHLPASAAGTCALLLDDCAHDHPLVQAAAQEARAARDLLPTRTEGEGAAQFLAGT